MRAPLNTRVGRGGLRCRNRRDTSTDFWVSSSSEQSKTRRGPTHRPVLSFVQTTRNRRSAILAQWVDPAAGDGAGDDALLDLLGALEDVHGRFKSSGECHLDRLSWSYPDSMSSGVGVYQAVVGMNVGTDAAGSPSFAGRANHHAPAPATRSYAASRRRRRDRFGSWFASAATCSARLSSSSVDPERTTPSVVERARNTTRAVSWSSTAIPCKAAAASTSIVTRCCSEADRRLCCRRSNGDRSHPVTTPSSSQTLHHHRIAASGSARTTSRNPAHGRRLGRRSHRIAVVHPSPTSPAVAALTIRPSRYARRCAGPGTSGGRPRKCSRSETITACQRRPGFGGTSATTPPTAPSGACPTQICTRDRWRFTSARSARVCSACSEHGRWRASSVATRSRQGGKRAVPW